MPFAINGKFCVKITRYFSQSVDGVNLKVKRAEENIRRKAKNKESRSKDKSNVIPKEKQKAQQKV